MRQKLIDLQGEIDEFIIIVGGFTTPQSVIDRFSWQKISKDIVELNSNIDQMIQFASLHPTTAKYTLFSSLYGTFIKVDHILGHKTELNQFKVYKSYTICS